MASNTQVGVDLKKESEVREYLDNLGTEYRFGCYSQNDAKACQLLAEYMERIKMDFEKAFKIYQVNCDTNSFPNSCGKAGYYLCTGDAGVHDPVQGYEYLKKGCDLGHPKGCLLAGMYSYTDWKDEKANALKNKAQSAPYLSKACDLGQHLGCARFGELNIQGEHVPKNPENAIEAFKKGCELHNFSCCVNAMLMYKTGDGIPQDMELAKVYKKKAEDIRDHIQKDKDRISFQEGSETAGESGILGEQSYTL